MVILGAFQIVGCNFSHTTQKMYDIKVGEEFEIYIDENSCCQNCWQNEKLIKSIQLVSTKCTDWIKNTDDGGTTHYAWKFRGIAEGSDSIRIVRISGGDDCSNPENVYSDVVIQVNVRK